MINIQKFKQGLNSNNVLFVEHEVGVGNLSQINQLIKDKTVSTLNVAMAEREDILDNLDQDKQVIIFDDFHRGLNSTKEMILSNLDKFNDSIIIFNSDLNELDSEYFESEAIKARLTVITKS
ncbi:MAG: hypothetical protein SLAVMIC_01006 [uncultured marine phage]|uniref:Uncharacterized protein n=1 Tax=uncultured marine phage TaxID=707152 RepID=A0A8D9CD43_9VIRU|nr:MAG: hypothetical protein SLAVMIC_01006 [uncultured marine phage]